MYVRDLPLLLFAGVVVGWLLGGLTGFARRDLRDETFTLLDAVETRRAGRRRWFERNDASTQAAMLAGLICGGLLAFTSLANTGNAVSVSLGLDTVELGADDECRARRWRARRGLPGPLLNFLTGLANVLSPVAWIALFVFGALAIIFIKDPPRWFGSRWSAATFAGTVTGALLFVVVSRGLY